MYEMNVSTVVAERSTNKRRRWTVSIRSTLSLVRGFCGKIDFAVSVVYPLRLERYFAYVFFLFDAYEQTGRLPGVPEIFPVNIFFPGPKSTANATIVRLYRAPSPSRLRSIAGIDRWATVVTRSRGDGGASIIAVNKMRRRHGRLRVERGMCMP